MKYFLGHSPKWYKMTILGFIIVNFVLFLILPALLGEQEGKTILSWIFIAEFIFTLAMALQCYPLLSGGLLALEIILLGLTTPGHPGEAHGVYHEVSQNLEVILLLMFMVAAIYFMKPLLMYIFSKVFTKIKSKVALSLLFVLISAFLSAFLDALTVTAVLISVAIGFYSIYHKIHSGEKDFDGDGTLDKNELSGETLEQFRSFLRSLVMHGVVGTAMGGVCTLVGEPQNLLIGNRMGWDFVDFFTKMMPISLPVFAAGLLTTIVLELTGWFGFGAKLPAVARTVIEGYTKEEDRTRTDKQKWGLIVQGVSAALLITGLALHIAPVGFIGLSLIVIQTVFMGIIEENKIGHAFEEALPFTALLVVFFVVVSMIHDQHLFKPIIDWALSMDKNQQPGVFYIANGLLSSISDNVFVATIYISEVEQAFKAGVIDRAHFEKLAIAINTGTNLPSVATPNGQAAFLFLLTSALAPLINLSYVKMLKMAFPYTIVLGGFGYVMVRLVLG